MTICLGFPPKFAIFRTIHAVAAASLVQSATFTWGVRRYPTPDIHTRYGKSLLPQSLRNFPMPTRKPAAVEPDDCHKTGHIRRIKDPMTHCIDHPILDGTVYNQRLGSVSYFFVRQLP